MTKITSKSTKAQILEAYVALEAEAAQGPSWGQIAATALETGAMVGRELIGLVAATYNAGSVLRQWISETVAILSRPVLRSKA
jgi:hypothetical protein